MVDMGDLDREDALNVLYEVKQVISANNWVVFDTETTGLEGQIIEWAICGPNGEVLGQGRVKPTVPITEGARAVHGISDEMLQNEPTFDTIVHQIYGLLKDKTVVGYNTSFDLTRAYYSLSPYTDWENNLYEEIEQYFVHNKNNYCAMEWFAVIYGVKHEYYRTYTWQKLSTACAYLDIQHNNAHTALSDAQATAMLVQKLAELAKEKLPAGYHPPCDVPCTGGCGQTLGPFHYDEDKTWYCAGCGLKAGINHLCKRCEENGRRTIVYNIRNSKTPIPPNELCYQCRFTENMANGTWHTCPRCTRYIEANAEEQPYCKHCTTVMAREKEARQKYNKQYRERLKQQDRRLWEVREWYRYGKWDRHVARKFFFEAVTRKEALEQYHAQYKPEYAKCKITAW